MDRRHRRRSHGRVRRFARQGAHWALQVEAPAPPEGPLAISIDRDFHDAQEVGTVTPRPSRVTVNADEVTYEFAVAPEGDPITIQFRFTADALWRHPTTLSVAGGPRFSFAQFVYP